MANTHFYANVGDGLHNKYVYSPLLWIGTSSTSSWLDEFDPLSFPRVIQVKSNPFFRAVQKKKKEEEEKSNK